MGSAYNRVIETRKELTKQLLAEMEQGELPWMKGWKTTGTRPYNPVTKAVYKGNNRLRLMLASHFGQFQDNRWVTFNQAKDKGWKIKSGEKGTLCEKWIFEEKKVIEDPVTGEKETVYEELEHPKVNYFILFNADQVDGIPEKEKKEQQQKLISVIREELQKDSVPANFIDITRLGLVELTRKKVYKSLREILS